MNNKDEKIQKTLDSLDGMQRATPGPFFYTRVSARLQKKQKASWTWISNVISRPVIAFSGLCLIIMLNIFVMVNQSAQTGTSNDNTDLALADELAMTNSNFYDLENPEAR